MTDYVTREELDIVIAQQDEQVAKLTARVQALEAGVERPDVPSPQVDRSEVVEALEHKTP